MSIFRRYLHLAPPLAGAIIFSIFYLPIARALPVPDSHFLRVAWRILHGPWSAASDFMPLLGCEHGPGEIYLTVPFAALFGPVPAAILWRNALCAMAALAATYGVGRRLTDDRWTAALAVLFLGSSPTFILFSAHGVFDGIAAVTLGMGCLYFFLAYADEGKPRLAYLGFGLLAMSLLTRSWMAAFAFGLLAAAAIHRRSLMMAIRIPPGPARNAFLLKCACTFFVVLLPLFAALPARWTDLRRYWPQRVMIPDSGESNLHYWPHLLFRLKETDAMLKGTASTGQFEALGMDLKPVSTTAPYWIACLGALIFGLERYRRGRTHGRWTLPLIVAAGYLSLAPFTPSLLSCYHLLPILPLIFIASSSIVFFARGAWRAALIAGACLLLFHVLSGDRAYFRERGRELALNGNPERDLTDWIAAQPARGVVTVGFAPDKLWVYGGDKIRAINFPDLSYEPGCLGDEFPQLAADRGLYWAVRLPDEDGVLPQLRSCAARGHYRLERVREFLHPRGDPALALYALGVSR